MLLCYTFEYISLMGPILVLAALWYILSGKPFNEKIALCGLSWNHKQFVLFFSAILSTALVSSVISRIFNLEFAYSSPIFMGVLYLIGQTLCEEICLGYIPFLYFFQNKKRHRNLLFKLSLLGISFGLLHQLFYTNPFRFESDPLTINAIVGLSLFGFIRLYSYLVTETIAFSWGVHLAWNLIFLLPELSINGAILNEPNRFRIIFSTHHLFVFLILTIVFFLVLSKKNRSLQ